MKAVILAAGKGTRMGNLTSTLPKPMLKVQGKPILEHIIEGLVGAGITEICIVTGWKAEIIEDYFGDGKNFGTRISYGRREIIDGTGKAPEAAKHFISSDHSEPFLLTYGDILVRPETYPAMIKRFMEREFSSLVTVTPGQDISKGGVNFFDKHFHLKHLVEKPSPAQLQELREKGWLTADTIPWYNAGIYIFRPHLFDFTARLEKSPRGEYELTDAIAAMLAADHTIAGMEIAGRWVDVRDPAILAQLEKESL